MLIFYEYEDNTQHVHECLWSFLYSKSYFLFADFRRYRFFFVYNDHDYDLVVPEGFCLKSNNKLVLEFQHYLIVFVLFCLFLVLCCVRVFCCCFFFYIFCLFAVFTKSPSEIRLFSVFSKYQQKWMIVFNMIGNNRNWWC